MMKRTIAFLVAAVAALAGSASAGAQATTVTRNEFVPVHGVRAGMLHVLSHVTIDDQGGLHVKQHFQPSESAAKV